MSREIIKIDLAEAKAGAKKESAQQKWDMLTEEGDDFNEIVANEVTYRKEDENLHPFMVGFHETYDDFERKANIFNETNDISCQFGPTSMFEPTRIVSDDGIFKYREEDQNLHALLVDLDEMFKDSPHIVNKIQDVLLKFTPTGTSMYGAISKYYALGRKTYSPNSQWPYGNEDLLLPIYEQEENTEWITYDDKTQEKPRVQYYSLGFQSISWPKWSTKTVVGAVIVSAFGLVFAYGVWISKMEKEQRILDESTAKLFLTENDHAQQDLKIWKTEYGYITEHCITTIDVKQCLEAVKDEVKKLRENTIKKNNEYFQWREDVKYKEIKKKKLKITEEEQKVIDDDPILKREVDEMKSKLQRLRQFASRLEYILDLKNDTKEEYKQPFHNSGEAIFL